MAKPIRLAGDGGGVPTGAGPPMDPHVQRAVFNTRNDFDIKETARSARDTRQLIEALVEHSVETAQAAEIREREMLRWAQAGVLLAGIAALASVIAIVITILVAP